MTVIYLGGYRIRMLVRRYRASVAEYLGAWPVRGCVRPCTYSTDTVLDKSLR